MTMNTIISSPKPSKQPQTLEFRHGYVVPPHCRARSRHTMAQMRKNAPGRSIFATFSPNLRLLCFRWGALKKIKVVRKARPPNARRIHQLNAFSSIGRTVKKKNKVAVQKQTYAD